MTELLGGVDGQVLVRFRLPHSVEADRVALVGDFNDWSQDANLMEQDEEGFMTELTLAQGRAYRFRYLLDGERWENDWAADAYLPNEFGGDDSVIDLTRDPLEALPNAAMVQDVVHDVEEPPPAAKPKRTRKKAAQTES